jgi:hypothetical protein
MEIIIRRRALGKLRVALSGTEFHVLYGDRKIIPEFKTVQHYFLSSI